MVTPTPSPSPSPSPSPLRLRLVFKDHSILNKTQRSEGMNHSWLLLKSQQHQTISDVCTHLLHFFKLNHSCPNGILLSMEGFTLPPFESTEILKDKEIICVEKKGAKTTDAGNLLDEVEDDELEPGDNGLLRLENNKIDKAREYHSESEGVDEDQTRDEELVKEAAPKKRKASTNLQNLTKKSRYSGVVDKDADEAETEETENDNNDASHHMAAKINSKNETSIKATSNKKVQSPSIVKRGEELLENVEEVKQVSTAPEAKKISRTSRRKKFQRKKKRELAEIAKNKPKACSKPKVTKHKSEEANGQPKGLLYWKNDIKKFVQNGDVGTIAATRPGHIRFEDLDGDQAAKPTGVSNRVVIQDPFRRNGSSSKKKGQNWGREKFLKFKRDDTIRKNKDAFKMLFCDSHVPVIDINDFDKLPPCCEPKEGDVIAYRLLELNSSWIPEFSSFRVGRIAYYDAKDIVLIPVPKYPIVSEKVNDNGLNDPLYGEDGSLEINYSALVDVRNIMQHNGVNQTRPTNDATEKLEPSIIDNNIDVSKDNPGEVNPWDSFSSKSTEMPELKHSELNPCSYGGAGPSTTTGPDANEEESSGVKEGQKDNLIDRWLANKPDLFQENNTSSPDVTKMGPIENDGENGSSWGKPWSAFVVSRGSSVIQAYKENDGSVGSSRNSRGTWPRGAPRGRGRGHNRGRGRGRNG